MEGFILMVVVLSMFAKPLYRAYVFHFRPAQYEAEQQRKHELELAKAQAQAQARQTQTGQIVGGIAGAAAKALLSAVFKGRPHH